MKVAVQGYHAGKAWLCICVGVEPPFSKSWIRHCILNDCYTEVTAYTVLDYSYWISFHDAYICLHHAHYQY